MAWLHNRGTRLSRVARRPAVPKSPGICRSFPLLSSPTFPPGKLGVTLWNRRLWTKQVRRGDSDEVRGREIRGGGFESVGGSWRYSTNHTSAHWLHLLSSNFRATKTDVKSRWAQHSSSCRTPWTPPELSADVRPWGLSPGPDHTETSVLAPRPPRDPTPDGWTLCARTLTLPTGATERSRPETVSTRHTSAPVGLRDTAKVALQAAQALPARTVTCSCPKCPPPRSSPPPL